MKKILLYLSALAIFATGIMGCSQQKQWNHEQRKAMREALRNYRQIAYLNNLDDAEFTLFTDNVAGMLETDYPVYASFIEMPGMTDTVDMVVVMTVVEELNADAANMRYIYPYTWLVSQGVLPAGLNSDQQKSFYKCFASKVNASGWTLGQFYSAVLADTTDTSSIRQMEAQCANDLFEWSATEVEILETTNP